MSANVFQSPPNLSIRFKNQEKINYQNIYGKSQQFTRNRMQSNSSHVRYSSSSMQNGSLNKPKLFKPNLDMERKPKLSVESETLKHHIEKENLTQENEKLLKRLQYMKNEMQHLQNYKTHTQKMARISHLNELEIENETLKDEITKLNQVIDKQEKDISYFQDIERQLKEKSQELKQRIKSQNVQEKKHKVVQGELQNEIKALKLKKQQQDHTIQKLKTDVIFQFSQKNQIIHQFIKILQILKTPPKTTHKIQMNPIKCKTIQRSINPLKTIQKMIN